MEEKKYGLSEKVGLKPTERVSVEGLGKPYGHRVL